MGTLLDEEGGKNLLFLRIYKVNILGDTMDYYEQNTFSLMSLPCGCFGYLSPC